MFLRYVMFIVNSLASLSKNTLQIDQNDQTQTTNLKKHTKIWAAGEFGIKSISWLTKIDPFVNRKHLIARDGNDSWHGTPFTSVGWYVCYWHFRSNTKW